MLATRTTATLLRASLLATLPALCVATSARRATPTVQTAAAIGSSAVVGPPGSVRRPGARRRDSSPFPLWSSLGGPNQASRRRRWRPTAAAADASTAAPDRTPTGGPANGQGGGAGGRGDDGADDCAPPPVAVAESALSALARGGRTWRRLRHVAELACLAAAANDGDDLRTAADVGCDHGLLAIGLAASGMFDGVVGVDASKRALGGGAAANLRVASDFLRSKAAMDGRAGAPLPVDFRLGDGLLPLDAGEADAVCVAGMGVNTMLDILLGPEMDRVGCRRLFVQPTNSLPRNLALLYGRLGDSGWGLRDERIEYLSGRWYVTAAFARTDQPTRGGWEMQLPGDFLKDLPLSVDMGRVYRAYVRHHTGWIETDAGKKGGRIPEDVVRWLEANRPGL